MSKNWNSIVFSPRHNGSLLPRLWKVVDSWVTNVNLYIKNLYVFVILLFYNSINLHRAKPNFRGAECFVSFIEFEIHKYYVVDCDCDFSF